MPYQNIDVEEFKKKLAESSDAFILDVRTEPELVEGSIPGYTMINGMAPNFKDEVEKLDKEKTYFVYCRSGGRSEKASQLMERMGFQKVYNLLGGIHAWNEEAS